MDPSLMPNLLQSANSYFVRTLFPARQSSCAWAGNAPVIRA